MNKTNTNKNLNQDNASEDIKISMRMDNHLVQFLDDLVESKRFPDIDSRSQLISFLFEQALYKKSVYEKIKAVLEKLVIKNLYIKDPTKDPLLKLFYLQELPKERKRLEDQKTVTFYTHELIYKQVLHLYKDKPDYGITRITKEFLHYAITLDKNLKEAMSVLENFHSYYFNSMVPDILYKAVEIIDGFVPNSKANTSINYKILQNKLKEYIESIVYF
jgi:Arc/MetJ-type ribon-helix-helix transcriptional regulator